MLLPWGAGCMSSAVARGGERHKQGASGALAASTEGARCRGANMSLMGDEA